MQRNETHEREKYKRTRGGRGRGRGRESAGERGEKKWT